MGIDKAHDSYSDERLCWLVAAHDELAQAGFTLDGMSLSGLALLSCLSVEAPDDCSMLPPFDVEAGRKGATSKLFAALVQDIPSHKQLRLSSSVTAVGAQAWSIWDNGYKRGSRYFQWRSQIKSFLAVVDFGSPILAAAVYGSVCMICEDSRYIEERAKKYFDWETTAEIQEYKRRVTESIFPLVELVLSLLKARGIDSDYTSGLERELGFAQPDATVSFGL